MRIVLHAPNSDPHFAAIAAGCAVAGIDVDWSRPSVWAPDCIVKNADAVVVHGVWAKNGEIADAYRARNVPVWIMENARLRIEPNAIGLYLNSLQWLPDYICRRAVAADVLTDRTQAAVLVCGQKPDDKAHGMDAAGVDRWARRAVELARMHQGLQVVYRPHPLDTRQRPEDHYGADLLSTWTLETDLRNAVCVYTYNSTVGWDAIAAGVPVYGDDPECSFGEFIGNLAAEERTHALGRAASSQWTVDELADGTAVRALFCNQLPGLPVDADTFTGVLSDPTPLVDVSLLPMVEDGADHDFINVGGLLLGNATFAALDDSRADASLPWDGTGSERVQVTPAEATAELVADVGDLLGDIGRAPIAIVTNVAPDTNNVASVDVDHKGAKHQNKHRGNR